MDAKQFARRPNRSVAREMYQTRHGGRDLTLCPYGTTPSSCTNADCADGECLSRSAQCSLSVPSDKHDDGAARQQETMLTVELAGPISAKESSRLSYSTEADRQHSGNEGKAPGTFSHDRIKATITNHRQFVVALLISMVFIISGKVWFSTDTTQLSTQSPSRQLQIKRNSISVLTKTYQTEVQASVTQPED